MGRDVHPPLKIIARIKSDFPTKFGLPRQSGLVSELCGKIIFEPGFRNPDALRGIDGYSHIWLIWGFSETERDTWSPTVRPPRLGGNTRMGVFATRSPFRPNAIALSCVKLDSVEPDTPDGPILNISGADMMDGTPIYDIKPYLPLADCHPEATGGFSELNKDHRLEVSFPDELLYLIPEAKRAELIGALSNDPRPAYQNDPDRVYGFLFTDLDIRFTVKDGILTVCGVSQM